MTKLQKGDAVSWNAPGGSANGHVKKKLIHDTRIKGHLVKASMDDPQHLVETGRGGKAAHKASALKKNDPDNPAQNAASLRPPACKGPEAELSL